MAEKLDSMCERLRMQAVDALAGLLDGPRARGAFLLRSRPGPALVAADPGRGAAHAGGHGAAARRGSSPTAATPVALGRGDVAIIRGPEPYTVADDPATPPQVVIHPGQRCTTPDGRGPRPGDGPRRAHLGQQPATASTVMLIGTYKLRGEVSRRLLGALPPLLVLSSGRTPGTPRSSPLLADEIVKDEPGQEVVLDRLLDLLLIAVLRAWFARPGGGGARLVPGPRATRSSAGRCGCCTTTRRTRGRWPRWPPRPASRGRRWPGGSPSSSASRR